MATHQKNVISEYADHVLAFQNYHLVQMDREGLEKNALVEEKQHRQVFYTDSICLQFQPH